MAVYDANSTASGSVYFFPAMGTCVICLEPISPDMGMVDCSHAFCLACIQKWTRACSACPICRSDVTAIRHFYRSFFMGDETRVPKRQQEMPIPDDTHPEEENADHFVDDEIVYESQPPPPAADAARGTAWCSGQRVSLRTRRTPRADFYRQFRSQLFSHKQNGPHQRIRPLCRGPVLFVDSFLEPEPAEAATGQPFLS
jgi:hypothetical protein